MAIRTRITDRGVIQEISDVPSLSIEVPGNFQNIDQSVTIVTQLPATGTYPDGVMFYVAARKSIYRSSSAGWVRLPIADPSWMTQTAWGIDTVNGNDDNVGSVVSPLRSWAELRARLPAISQPSYTVTIAAGSSFTASDPITWSPTSITVGSFPIISVTATRTLGSNLTISTSSDEATNVPPRVDAGVAFPIGTILQATSGAQIGATTTVCEVVAGTNFNVSKWGSSSGVAVAPPAPGDTIAVVTLVSVNRFGFASPTAIPLINGLDIANLQNDFSTNVVFQVCRISGSFSLSRPGFMQLDRCFMNSNSFFYLSAPSVSLIANLCGIVRTGASNLPVYCGSGAVASFTHTLVIDGGFDCERYSSILLNHVGIRKAPVAAVAVHNHGFVTVTNTLYGANNPALGTMVKEGGHMTIYTGYLPTLASVGQELELEGATTANPLSSGIPTTAVSLLNWSTWSATFGRNVMSYTSGASINNRLT